MKRQPCLTQLREPNLPPSKHPSHATLTTPPSPNHPPKPRNHPLAQPYHPHKVANHPSPAIHHNPPPLRPRPPHIFAISGSYSRPLDSDSATQLPLHWARIYSSRVGWHCEGHDYIGYSSKTVSNCDHGHGGQGKSEICLQRENTGENRRTWESAFREADGSYGTGRYKN